MGLNKILGSGLSNPSSGPALGTLGNAIFNTQTASLEGLYMVDEDLATAKNNPGLQDSSGNSRTATHLSTTNPSFDSFFTYQNGPQNNILSYISGSAYGWLAPLPSSAIPTNWTMLAFVNNTGNGSAAVAFSDVDAVVNRGLIALRMYDTNALLLDAFNDAGTRTIMANISGLTNVNDAWSMVVATYGGGTDVKIYHNGSDVTAGTLRAQPAAMSSSHFVGGAASQTAAASSLGISGDLGPYALWSSVLTPAEISAIYTASGL